MQASPKDRQKPRLLAILFIILLRKAKKSLAINGECLLEELDLIVREPGGLAEPKKPSSNVID